MENIFNFNLCKASLKNITPYKKSIEENSNMVGKEFMNGNQDKIFECL